MPSGFVRISGSPEATKKSHVKARGIEQKSRPRNTVYDMSYCPKHGKKRLVLVDQKPEPFSRVY